jgi:hypothetical protein
MVIHGVAHVQKKTLDAVEVSFKICSCVVVFKTWSLVGTTFNLLINLKVEIIASLYYFVLFYIFLYYHFVIFLTHSQLLEGLKSESKYKIAEGGGIKARSLAHNTLRGREACWSSEMGLGRINKLHSLTHAYTQPTQGG